MINSEMNVQIEKMTRGTIVLSVGPRKFRFSIEAFLPGCGSPDFDIFPADTMEVFPNGSRSKLPAEEAERILALLCEELDACGNTYEIQRPSSH